MYRYTYIYRVCTYVHMRSRRATQNPFVCRCQWSCGLVAYELPDHIPVRDVSQFVSAVRERSETSRKPLATQARVDSLLW